MMIERAISIGVGGFEGLRARLVISLAARANESLLLPNQTSKNIAQAFMEARDMPDDEISMSYRSRLNKTNKRTE